MGAALLAFLQQYLGRANTGDTPENAGQCVGLVEVWIDVNKHPHIFGNAADLLVNEEQGALHRHDQRPCQFPCRWARSSAGTAPGVEATAIPRSSWRRTPCSSWCSSRTTRGRSAARRHAFVRRRGRLDRVGRRGKNDESKVYG